MRKHLMMFLPALALAACDNDDSMSTTGPSLAAKAASHTYSVTIENLTTGQPLSPGVLVTHTKKASLFMKDNAASEGLRLIAENGDPSTAAAALPSVSGVQSVVATTAPVGRTGGGPFPNTLTTEIDAAANANYLSMALMLICTNDGFAGLEGVRLPGGFNEAVFYARAYDAGTEVNTEVASSIVPPCFGIGPVQGPTGGGDRTAEDGTVQPHSGIEGIADLGDMHSWNGPVAKVTVQRIK